MDFGRKISPKHQNKKLIWKRKEVIEFKYLGTDLCKHGCMKVELKEKAVKGRQVVGVMESYEKNCELGGKEAYKE